MRRDCVLLLSFCRSSRGVSRINRPLLRRSRAGVARRSICCVDCMCARMACGVVGGPPRLGTFRADARVVPGVVLALPFAPRGPVAFPEDGAGVVGFSIVLWSLPRALSCAAVSRWRGGEGKRTTWKGVCVVGEAARELRGVSLVLFDVGSAIVLQLLLECWFYGRLEADS